MDEIQIVFALAVLYVTYRWWSRPSASGTGSTSSSSASTSSSNATNERLNHLANNMIPPSHIAQVQTMFPQLNEREIQWEFVRTGRTRNVEQVVQFLLDSPPAQPPTWFLPPVIAQAPTTSSTKRSPKHPSLIERLGLEEQAKQQDKAHAEGTAQSSEAANKGKSTDRRMLEEWRSMSMQEKKAKLVLDARRRLLEKDTKAAAA